MAGEKFAVEIVRDLKPDELGWYSRDANPQDSLGINRRYEDLRAFGWEDVQAVLEIERDVITQIEAMTFDDDDENAEFNTPEDAATSILETHEAAQDCGALRAVFKLQCRRVRRQP